MGYTMASKGLRPGRKKGVNRDRLTTQQQVFVDEYLANGMNAMAAATVAKYGTPRTKAGKLLKDPKIRAYLERELTILQEQQFLRRAQLVDKMQRLNDFNLMKYARNSNGKSLIFDEKHYDEIADLIGDCVTKVKVVEEVDKAGVERKWIEIELMPKMDMFKLECQYLGMLAERKDITVTAGEGLLHTLLERVEGTSPVITDDVIEGRVL